MVAGWAALTADRVTNCNSYELGMAMPGALI